MEKFRLKIIDIIEEAKDTKTYLLEKPADFSWVEGAHTHIGLVGFDEGERPNKGWVRHMSIMTLEEDKKIGFTTRLVSPCSEFKEKLSALLVGDEVVLFKIDSKMFLRREDKPIVLLSMGVGIATMRPLIYGFVKDSSHIPSLININVDSSKDFVYHSELNDLQNSSYKNYWLGSRGEFYKELERVSVIEDALYYVVGSDEFIKDVIKTLKTKEIPVEHIFIDKKDEIQAEFFK